jgi:hypothetical protein
MEAFALMTHRSDLLGLEFSRGRLEALHVDCVGFEEGIGIAATDVDATTHESIPAMEAFALMTHRSDLLGLNTRPS